MAEEHPIGRGKRVLVCGGRDFGHTPEEQLLFQEAMALYAGAKPEVIIHGCAQGADTLADHWAEKRTIPVLRFRAEWDIWGKAAGPMRNSKMLVNGKPTLAIAFPGGNGTADMVEKARKAGVRVVEVKP